VIPNDLLRLIKLGCVVCAALAIVSAFGAVIYAPDTLAGRLYLRYVIALERRMRLMFIDTRGSHIVAAQGLAMAAVLALGLTLGLPLLFLALPLIGAAPMLVLERKRKQRVQKIEQKLDAFVVALANALRATPSPGRALAMVHTVTPPPLDREIELVLREMRVGSTLEQALGNLSARVRSFQLDAALSGLLIGRQTGGNVPQILDGAAETLREMARLSGVLRAKTADGRAQANVLAVFPALLIFAFDWASPGYFRPLTDSAGGVMVTLIALSMWLGAVLMIRRIMEAEL
jgi:tight adherence protein B